MYRTITVNKKKYQYVVGKTHTKIKGVGLFANSAIGHQVELHCECCNESLNTLYGEDESHYKLGVTPADIARCIKNN